MLSRSRKHILILPLPHLQNVPAPLSILLLLWLKATFTSFLDSSQCVLASLLSPSCWGLGPPSTWSSQSSEPPSLSIGISLPPTGKAAKDACLVEVEGEMLLRNSGMLPEIVWTLRMGLPWCPSDFTLLYQPQSQKFELQLVGVLYDAL